MYKVKDNAESQLQFGISSVATTLVVKEGQGAKFPEVPFLVVLNKRNSDGEITKSEKVEVSAVSGDQFTISRGYEGTTPSDFSADDFVSLFVLARHIEELQTEVAKKADQTDVQSVAQKTSVLEEKMTTAEGQISQLVEAGVVDHLEESGIVGEKYTLENQLFKQYTPKAEDSTIAINVGDIDKNKESHIQRIGSGTASNQLKLKLKKFGAPTTSVVVEVRKGVKVDVSDKEAYRYGGEVVASTTIAYTEFTTDWKDFTLTLNNQFGGTKGELLDIVVYQQGGIVNGTNYYQIACDSTQYSEAFSYVSIYNNNRERGYLMPYCISKAFEDSLLCKTISTSLKSKSDTYQSPEETRRVYRGNDATLGAYNVNNILSQTPVGDIDISLTTTWDYGYTYNRVTVNDVVAMSAPGQKTFNGIKVKQGDVIKLQSRYDMSQSSIYTDYQYNTITATYNYLHENYKTIKKVVGFSNELKLIGSYGSFVFFGLKDGEFYNGLSESINTNSETSTTATTGTIIPGNFVGYFKLGKYRVPFYTE